ITDDTPTYDTALDVVLLRPFDESVDQGREFLRGYSWVTICPREIAERLGGADALRQTEAFVDVRALQDGGVFLGATPTIGEYDDAAMRKVFRALGPVLPPGMPKRQVGWENLRVVYEDAASIRER